MDLRWPRPIIEAFYVHTPQILAKSLGDETCAPEASTKQLAVPEALRELRDLQRICINSEFLFQELMDMAPVPLVRDTIMLVYRPARCIRLADIHASSVGPPYKVRIVC